MGGISLRFDFDETFPGDDGMVECGICFKRFEYPEVGVDLRGFVICPSCVLSGPAAVAAEAVRDARERVRQRYPDEDPIDQRAIVNERRRLARQLRRVDSFLNIPGGATALAIVNVKPEDIERGYRRRKVA